MSIEGLNLPSKPFRGFFVNKNGGQASISDLPLISHVEDNLYVGGCLDSVDLGDFFTHIFSLYKWEKYSHGENTLTRQWTMYDSRHGVEVMDLDENPLTIEEVADEVVEALSEGGNVLVHCQAGINRSNLTAALTLMKWKGLTAEDAIAKVREKRSPHALANRSFEKYLLALDEKE